ncbi:MAG: glycosyltransferase [Thermoleophilia bacterium]
MQSNLLHRTDPEPILLRRAALYCVPDTRFSWIPGAVLTGLAKSWRARYDAILSMSPDESAHIVGCILAMLSRKPWVADFRDMWTDNPFRHEKALRLLELMDDATERCVIERATRITVTSLDFANVFGSKYGRTVNDKIHHIPNGYDPDDFLLLKPIYYSGLRIVHAGSLFPGRPAAPFLRGLALLRMSNPQAIEGLTVLFLGGVDAPSQPLITELQLDAIIEARPRTQHRQALRHMLGASALLLITGAGKGTITGKVFEYIASQRPIFAITDSPEVRTILGNTPHCIVPTDADPALLATSLGRFVAGLARCQDSPRPFLGPRFNDVNHPRLPNDRYELAGLMARVLDAAERDCQSARGYH